MKVAHLPFMTNIYSTAQEQQSEEAYGGEGGGCGGEVGGAHLQDEEDVTGLSIGVFS